MIYLASTTPKILLLVFSDIFKYIHLGIFCMIMYNIFLLLLGLMFTLNLKIKFMDFDSSFDAKSESSTDSVPDMKHPVFPLKSGITAIC